MKSLYKVILFFAIFLIVPLIINSLDVFPYTLYSEGEFKSMPTTDPISFVGWMFIPQANSYGLSYVLVGGIFTALVGFFTIGGTVFGFFSKSGGNFAPLAIIVLVFMFIPMLTRSLPFFNRMFTNWEIESLTLFGFALAAGIFVLFLITIIETPTHGRSGS